MFVPIFNKNNLYSDIKTTWY